MSTVVERGYRHKGAAFVEILQNCPIYNDGIFEQLKDKKIAADFRVEVEHGQPIVFGKEDEKGIRLNRQTLSLEVVEVGGNESELLVHDETNKVQAQLLAAMTEPDFPVAVGVLYREQKTSFNDDSLEQVAEARSSKGSMQELLLSGHTWEVE